MLRESPFRRHYTTAPDPCPLCDGRGHTIHPFTLANVGCFGCGGQATAGVFVVRVRVLTRRHGWVEHERSWQTDRFPVATDRVAAIAGRLIRGGRAGRPTEVRAYFVPVSGAVAECVSVARVTPIPTPPAAA